MNRATSSTVAARSRPSPAACGCGLGPTARPPSPVPCLPGKGLPSCRAVVVMFHHCHRGFVQRECHHRVERIVAPTPDGSIIADGCPDHPVANNAAGVAPPCAVVWSPVVGVDRCGVRLVGLDYPDRNKRRGRTFPPKRVMGGVEDPHETAAASRPTRSSGRTACLWRS